MQAVGRRQDRDPIRVKEEGASATLAQSLGFYNDVPTYEMQLDEFEEYALARLKVLRKIELLKSQNIFGDKFRAELDASIKTELLANGMIQASSMEGRKRDVASHFILRAAYCSTEEQRRWFLAQECALFRHRLERVMNNPDAFQIFLENASIAFDQIDDAEKERLRDKLMACPMGESSEKGSGSHVSLADFSKTAFYKIPFLQALDLVKSRLVYIERGYAYVPTSRLVSIVTSRFRMHLSESLIHASNAFGSVISEDPRIAPVLKGMNQLYTGRDFSNAGMEGGELTSQNVDDVAKQSMPLCMRQLHEGVKRDHKLKHWGRLQYGLFLKGAGMSMEESLTFFQREFCKIMTAEQYQKNYAYNVRHMYGKEGKRASYTPYNCQKIILGNAPQAGDHHGCPFRHYDDDNLSSLLSKMHINEKDKEEIIDLKRKKNYQIACQKHFLATHPGVNGMPDIQLDGVGNHPNAWFRASSAYHAQKSQVATSASAGNDQKKVASVTPLKS